MSGIFDQLRQQITAGDVLLPGDEGYKESLKRWSDSAERPAGRRMGADYERLQAVVVRVTSPEEVSTAVRFATAHKISLTARGGGHSTSGASSCDGGMVIDLARMRDVSVDPAARIVTYEGGCVFADVDSALAAHGLATVGGLYNQTGVGGLVLGGGLGFLTARHGLAIDNLISVDMVLADGSIVEVSETQKPDLFWAVRGAGAQLGIVTRFTSQAHPQGDVWGGPLMFSLDKLPELVAFANEFHNRTVADHNLIIAFGYAPEEYTTPVVIVGVFYNGPAVEGEQYFAPLLALGPIANMTGMMPYAATNTLFNPRFDGPGRRLMGSCSVLMPLNAEFIAEAGRRFLDFIISHSGMAKSVLVFEFFPTAAIRATPHDATVFASRGEHYLAVMALMYDGANHDAEVRNFKRHLSNYIMTTCGYHGKRASGDPAPFYVNLEHESLKPEDAFGNHVERLRELKHTYDPENVFHKWHGVMVEPKD
ncbi:FAD-linked oxidoreductase [Tolypocladium ophioglossoides CBS 100239]|uniref:FAD-linked oxidoreductase n=1 Tax=Tolypocladium ophioglossoides (strain CBS 100239) TaxID=1163406 RepID=A0A0L0N184_TOLOC|nr:FAD-linked oxidoreductase [Tolypocladium ophioglossoides CBS 100239]